MLRAGAIPTPPAIKQNPAPSYWSMEKTPCGPTMKTRVSGLTSASVDVTSPAALIATSILSFTSALEHNENG
jgi:hypothetical protein